MIRQLKSLTMRSRSWGGRNSDLICSFHSSCWEQDRRLDERSEECDELSRKLPTSRGGRCWFLCGLTKEEVEKVEERKRVFVHRKQFSRGSFRPSSEQKVWKRETFRKHKQRERLKEQLKKNSSRSLRLRYLSEQRNRKRIRVKDGGDAQLEAHSHVISAVKRVRSFR